MTIENSRGKQMSINNPREIKNESRETPIKFGIQLQKQMKTVISRLEPNKLSKFHGKTNDPLSRVTTQLKSLVKFQGSFEMSTILKSKNTSSYLIQN